MATGEERHSALSNPGHGLPAGARTGPHEVGTSGDGNALSRSRSAEVRRKPGLAPCERVPFRYHLLRRVHAVTSRPEATPCRSDRDRRFAERKACPDPRL
jgi:hypothetical protein